MFIKTVSTTSGINPIQFDETGGVFYWILNTGSSTIYASTKATFTAGDDGVVSLGPKESRRLETNNDTIYILGEGQVEIHNQRDGICSFKQAPTSSGGGGTIDAYSKTESDAKYAQKTDIPSSLPANGGNADTVDGLHANDFIKIVDFGESGTDTKTAIGQPGKTAIYRCTKWTDYPAEFIDGQGVIIAVNYNGSGAVGTDFIWCTQIIVNPRSGNKMFIRYIDATSVSDWKEISTTPIKKMTFPSVATNSDGAGSLFSADFGTPIVIACTSRVDTQCTPFYYRGGNLWRLLTKDAVRLDPIPAGSYSFDVWYI